jgi:hypothetical protein
MSGQGLERLKADVIARGINPDALIKAMLNQVIYHVDRALDSGPYTALNEMPAEELGSEIIRSCVILDNESKARAEAQAEKLLKIKQRAAGGKKDLDGQVN